jgi:hypothetical protein
MFSVKPRPPISTYFILFSFTFKGFSIPSFLVKFLLLQYLNFLVLKFIVSLLHSSFVVDFTSETSFISIFFHLLNFSSFIYWSGFVTFFSSFLLLVHSSYSLSFFLLFPTSSLSEFLRCLLFCYSFQLFIINCYLLSIHFL